MLHINLFRCNPTDNTPTHIIHPVYPPGGSLGETLFCKEQGETVNIIN